MADRTKLVRDRMIDAVEQLMLRGVESPVTLVRMVEVKDDDGNSRHLGDRGTAVRYMDAVRRRWLARNDQPELLRQELIQKAREVERRGWQVVAASSNESNVNGQLGAMNSILKAQEQQAKLLGLYVHVVKNDTTIHMDDDALNALKVKRIAEIRVDLTAEDPLRAIYGCDTPTSLV